MRQPDGGRSGQALVELAIIAMVLLLISLGAVQFGILYGTQLKVAHAAREGARYGAVHASHSDADIQQHALDAAPDLNPPLSLDDVAITTPDGRYAGRPIGVAVTYTRVPRLPMVGAMLPDPVVVHAAVKMRIEQ